MSAPQAALSVDLEFFSHTPAYRGATGETEAEAVGIQGVEFLLDELAKNDAKATFFVVSELTNTHADLVSQIAEEGHEIASHTQSHRLLTEHSTTERRLELAESRTRLEEVTGATVEGFRAPAFDIGDAHFNILTDTGYTYDSSVAPCRRIPGWYGGEYETLHPFHPTDSVGDRIGIAEVPVGVFPWLRLPLTGTWIRFFTPRYTTTGMRILARRGVAPVLYVHPWELVNLPSVDGIPSRVYWHTGAWMRRAVRRVLAQPFDFVKVRHIAAAADGR